MITRKPSDTTLAFTIGLIAGAMLLHEILLTRICALRLQFHFAFLVISNCLLCLGAAGTLLSLRRETFLQDGRAWLERFCLGNVISLVVTYLVLIRFPLPGNVQFTDPLHLVALSLFNLVGAIPFFFSGLAIGLVLMLGAERANRLYAIDLLAAGAGCLACPFLLPRVGAGGAFVTSAVIALAAYAASRWQRSTTGARSALCALGAAGLVLMPVLDDALPVPTKWIPNVPENLKTQSVWTSNSRIDLYRTEGCEFQLFMRGKNPRVPSPQRCAMIAQDATAATMIVDYSGQPEALDVLRTSMYAATYRLKPQSDVLIIGLGGGNDAWTAKAVGMRSIRAIELNWPIVDIHKHTMHSYSRALIEDPSVSIVVDEGRSAIMRDSNQYGVIQMTGIDTWTALASGAYVLAENYLYTKEALGSMYEHLAPGGILQVSRFALVGEAVRLISTLDAALSELGVTSVERSLMALSTPDNMQALMIKKGEFSDEEQETTERFALENGIEVVYLPNKPRPGWVDHFIRSDKKAELVESSPINVSPTVDDKPYFFNFYRWRNLVGALDMIEVPSLIAQGNPAFILIQLLFSVVLSVLLIAYPVLRSEGLPQRTARPFLIYFAGLGAGFISIELALMQKLTLFLGQPVYSLTVTLFSLLVFTGLGSLLLAGRFEVQGSAVLAIPVAIVLYIVLASVALEPLVRIAIALPLAARISITVLFLAPLGLLLGVPFAYGLRVAERVDPRIVPWAWAVNGCTSVVGSVLTVVVSMNFGFAVVLWAGSVLYAAAFAALSRVRLGVAPTSSNTQP